VETKSGTYKESRWQGDECGSEVIGDRKTIREVVGEYTGVRCEENNPGIIKASDGSADHWKTDTVCVYTRDRSSGKKTLNAISY
jgi:hypothetical protein